MFILDKKRQVLRKAVLNLMNKNLKLMCLVLNSVYQLLKSVNRQMYVRKIAQETQHTQKTLPNDARI